MVTAGFYPGKFILPVTYLPRNGTPESSSMGVGFRCVGTLLRFTLRAIPVLACAEQSSRVEEQLSAYVPSGMDIVAVS